MVTAGERASMLPGLKTEQAWLSSDNGSGVKVLLEDQMDNVIQQLENMIQEQLEGADCHAMSFAATLLANSMSFAHELCNYVTLTLGELRSSGFARRDNWYLVSKLIFRMFAVDFHKV